MFVFDKFRQRFTHHQNGQQLSNGSQEATRHELPNVNLGDGFSPVDLELWPDPQASNYANDVAVAGIGSVTNLLPEFYMGVVERQLASSALNQISGAATTHKDLDRLSDIAKGHPRFTSL